MAKLSVAWKITTIWYVSLLIVAIVGLLLGYFVFFEAYPGKPKIGVIDISFTVITDDSAFVISAFLDYARQNDDIKAVVIKLNSPGSAGAAGEKVYRETSKLREEKPVVIAMSDLVASGAYKWSMGANYTYARSGSWVGSVGVFITFPGPLIPQTPSEQVIATGPQKLTAGGRRQFLRLLDQLKENFYQTVAAERGDKLRISKEEILEGRIYNGNEAVRLGLVDAVGGDTEALEKAADLAGISDYELVDINTEVFRIFNQKSMRILEPLLPLLTNAGNQPGLAQLSSLTASPGSTGDAAYPLNNMTGIDMLRRFFLPSGVRQIQQEMPPGIPLNVDTPRIYHLYVGPTP